MLETIKALCKFIKEVTIEVLAPIGYIAEVSLRYISTIILFVTPYLMLWLGVHLYEQRGYFAFGGEVVVPVIAWFIANVLDVLANRANKGKRVPVPRERFTKVDDDGEVSVSNARIQELILYVADLEDWMHRKGWL